MANTNNRSRKRLTSTKQALLERWLKQGTGKTAARIERHQFDAEARPLSFAQEQLSFLEQLHSGSAVYNIPLAYRLHGILDAAALERSFIEIARRHETLRARLGFVDGRAVQLVAPEPDLAVPIVDLQALAEDERDAAGLRLAHEEAKAPFDLFHGPLMRIKLFRLQPQEHMLLVVVHHVVFDGWSAGNLEKELAELYDAFCADRPASLPALPIAYGDYALWQRASLDGKVIESQLEYWKKQLQHAPSLLELPTDRPRPALQRFNGARARRVIDKALLGQIKLCGQADRATLFMTLLAAFSALLSRYSRSDDVVVGSPTAGRTRTETEHLIGCFINTLPLRVNLSGDPSFRTLLSRVREMALAAYAHQDVPFEKLVEELKPERSPSYTPLLQVMFALQSTAPAPQFAGLRVERLELDRDTSEFDLSLLATEAEGELTLGLEYNVDLFDAATIERMLRHLETLLRDAVRNPGEKISRLALLTEAEKSALMQYSEQARVTHPNGETIVTLFEAMAARLPRRTAIEFRSASGRKTRISYRELNRRANQLAHHLIGMGVGREVLVGICLERSIDMVVALLGVLKAGGAYVPLDPAYPRERLAFMLEDAGLSVVVTERALAPEFQAARAVCLDGDRDRIAKRPDYNPVHRADARALAYVIYTSGSTGKPKGVCIEHGALANLLNAMCEHTAITELDSLLAVTTLSFDIAALELYLPLIAGARLVLASRKTIIDGEALSRCLADHRITLMQATPAMWRLLIEAGWKGSSRLRALCGGEALTRELADQLLERCRSLSNLYGPTETTIWSSAERVQRNGPISIGRPLANTEMHILDGALSLVPLGVPGELHIGGAGLARGYLNCPQLTQEKFISHPFRAGARLYKTGDLVRRRADGAIEFLGRMDHQVKLRGFRIELGEIEACLRQHPKLHDTAVILREDGGEKRLAAYLVADASVPPKGEELRSFLKNVLPDYMLPSSFTFLPAMPLTPNGKLDRKALPAPDGLTRDTAAVAPRTPLEEQVASIFSRVLNVERLSIRDNFFDLGGHSFLVLKVLTEIEKACGRRLSVATLFQAPTVEEIAQVLAAEEAAESSNVIVPLNPHGTTAPLFSVWMGIATELRELSRCLGAEQRMYGINSHWDPRQMRMTRIEEMAAYFLTHVRSIQPNGPYYLSSDCVSALTAFEMAQQLLANGEEVAALVVVDPPPPGMGMQAPAAKRIRERIHDYRTRVKRQLHSQGNAHPVKRLASLSARAVNAVLSTIALPVSLMFKRPLSRALLSRYIFDTHLKARDKYAPQSYAGRMWFIWAGDEMDERHRSEIQNAWSRLAPKAVHRTVPAMHADLFKEPHVKLLADEIRTCLAEARASSAPAEAKRATGSDLRAA